MPLRARHALSVFRKFAVQEGRVRPIGVEYAHDGEKVVCYFSADDRVDFRRLCVSFLMSFTSATICVRLASEEEAAVIGGYGHCGQELSAVRGLAFL